MAEFFAQWLMRASVMVPVMIVLAAASWWIFGRLGVMKRDALFAPADMRTWSLPFALGDAIVFSLVFSGIAAWMGDSSAAAAVAGGFAALVALAAPYLFSGAAKGK